MNKMAKTKPIRAPAEFVSALGALSEEFSRQTGFPHNNSATMRRMATQIMPNLVVKNSRLEFAILQFKKKKR